MSEIGKICITIFGSVVVYVVGRILENYIFSPLQEYNKTRGDIAAAILFYSGHYAKAEYASDEVKRDASSAIRKLASELSSKAHQVNKLLAWANIIPPHSNSMEAVAMLIEYSDSMWSDEYYDTNQKLQLIQNLLRIKIPAYLEPKVTL